jgi:hypothetical protein
METVVNNFTPFSPTHPGEVIREEIEYRECRSGTLLTGWACLIR